MSRAIDHTKRQLLPFGWGQWWRLAVLGLATAELGGGGCRSTFSGPPSPGSPPDWSVFGPALDALSLPLILAGIAAAAIVLFGILLLVLYVNSVCRFVLIDAIVSKRCAGLRSGWIARRRVGRRYFRWQLVYHTAIGIALAVVVGVPLAVAYFAGWLSQPQDHVALLVTAGLACVVILMACVIVALVVYVMAKDFLAPILAVDDQPVRDAWRRLLGLVRADPWGFAGYFGLKFLLSIAASIAMAIVALVVLIPLVIGALVAAVGVHGLPSPWEMTMTAPVIAAMGVGVLVLFVVLMTLSVPLVVFFPASGLYFLASRYPTLEAWLTTAPADARPVS